MEIDMLKHMKKFNSLIVVSMFVSIQLFSISVKAAGMCLSDKSDISEDTKKISQKLTVKYGISPIVNDNQMVHTKDYVEEIYDEQELKVDRSLPFLNQLNAVGVISDAPMDQIEEYGTAILISPCHVLTNAHAIKKEEARKGKVPVYVSLGQNSCEDNNEFLHQDMIGTVIAIGNDNYVAEDYAIVRISNVLDIKPVIVSIEYLSSADTLMMVGFPLKSTYSQKTGFKYPTANFVRVNSIGLDGTFKLTNRTQRFGGSGSGLFVLDKDEEGRAKVILAGIHQSSGGIGVQTAGIVRRLIGKNPSALEEVKKALIKGVCK